MYTDYQSFVDSLLAKYGGATVNYFSEKSYQRFLAGEIKSLSTQRAISRTAEGLYCHHIDENKEILVSTPAHIREFQTPYDLQKADRLVYCNLLEHGILHVLIAVENPHPVNHMRLGIGGYINFIRPELLYWFEHGHIPTAVWQRHCYDTVANSVPDVKQAVAELDDFLISHYPITTNILDELYHNFVARAEGFA